MSIEKQTPAHQSINNAIIQVDEVTKIYKSGSVFVRALDVINLTICKGEFTAIVGPSGCGKTTLLNTVGGLDKPNKGKVWVEGTDIHSLSDNRLINFRLHNIGFVFQAYNLIPVLTAYENVAFVMQLQNSPAKYIKERAETLLSQVGLGKQMSKRPGQLSGGQQQRVAVARALASKPKFVLADEPTSNLDSKSTKTLLDIMSRLNKEEGNTFVFSTHDPRVIERARRVVTLEDGKILEDERRADSF